jgi:hypothetical protein
MQPQLIPTLQSSLQSAQQQQQPREIKTTQQIVPQKKIKTWFRPWMIFAVVGILIFGLYNDNIKDALMHMIRGVGNIFYGIFMILMEFISLLNAMINFTSLYYNRLKREL